MPPLWIAIIVVLAVHYFLAIATVFVLLKDKGLVKAVIPWNLVILLVPIVGPVTYLIVRCFAKKN